MRFTRYIPVQNQPYAVIIEDEDGRHGWVASVPELPAVKAEGHTIEDVWRAIKDMLRIHLSKEQP